MSLESNLNFSASTLKVLTDEKTGKISSAKLNKTDVNGDKNISEKEALKAGIPLKDLDSVNKAFKQFDFSCNANVQFPEKSTSTKEFDAIWKTYGTDKGELPATITTVDQLKKSLCVSDDFKNAPQLKTLLDNLSNTDEYTLTYLNQIGKSHGLITLNDISSKLNTYISSGATVDGVDKKTLVKDLLHDISYPSDIAQESKGTCAAAAIQMKVAIENPTEYVNIATTLAQGKDYKTAGEKVLKPNNTWKGDCDDARTTSCKIVQNSFMVGAGNTSYTSKNDKMEGANSDGQATLMQNVFGDSDYNVDLLYTGNKLYEFVEDDIARGKSVGVSFKGHAVLAVGIDKTTNPAQVIMNSWGKRFSMSVDEFKQHVKAVKNKDDDGYDDKKTSAGSKVIIGE